MKNFTYIAPATVEEAAKILRNESGAVVIAGGMTLIPDMKLLASAPDTLVDLVHIKELRGISEINGHVRIGALVTHEEIADSDVIDKKLTAFAAMVGSLGDPAVRAMGTIGGAIAVNHPSADYPAAVLALDGIILTNKREIVAGDFFIGENKTLLEQDEIILSVDLAIPSRTSYAVIRGQANTRPVCGVFLAKYPEKINATVTGLSQNGVFRWSELEQALSTTEDFSFLPNAEMKGVTSYLSTINASGSYRRHLAGVLAKRAALAL